ncbi:MAG: hypothetical protein P8Y70_01490 [Candidatus Lokiarchaeota archaeon]
MTKGKLSFIKKIKILKEIDLYYDVIDDYFYGLQDFWKGLDENNTIDIMLHIVYLIKLYFKVSKKK